MENTIKVKMARLKGGGVRGIALSGYGSDEDMVGTAQAGFSAHLIKPVRITALKAAIERVAGTAPRQDTLGAPATRDRGPMP